MKLRVILIVLSLLAFLSTSLGGYSYYTSLKEAAFKEANVQTALQLETIKNHLSSFLGENLKSARVLAGLKELQQALFKPDNNSLKKANSVLDHFKNALDVNVCYLIDRNGNTIASSNRDAPDSFVGENYAFRPYFRKAIKGSTSIYMALGVTSGKRGVYYSHSVCGKDRDVPIGVAVIKASITPLEKDFKHVYEGTIVLTDPHGVVFISNREDWLYKLLWELSPDQISQIAMTRQFGNGPWSWSGLKKDKNHVIDKTGNAYLMQQVELDNYPGWNVIYLRGFREIAKKVFDPLIRSMGNIILAICVFIGLSVLFLYKQASNEIVKRRKVEKTLRESEERYRSLYNNTPAMLHSIDAKGRLVSVSDYWVEALGYEPDEVIGRNFTEFLTEDSRLLAEERVFSEFLRTGFVKDIPYQFTRKNGETIDVLLSAIAERDDKGDIVRSLAVLIDVTARKRAEEELKLAKEKLGHYSKDLELQVKEKTREITSIIKYMPAVVYIKDKEYRYVMVNSQFEELFDVRNQEIVGKTDYEIFPEKIAAQFRTNEVRVFKERQSIQVEESVSQKDGTHAYLSVKFPLYDEQESVRGLCGIAMDITVIKRAQDQLRRLSCGIIASQEKERAVIARELHDELGQMLTALRMDCVWIKEGLGKNNPKMVERTLIMCNLID
ncbi:MAG: PAS domain S-box protein, partial [Syntrophales bacterium]|nr:PAS domain S-box protein [Syntrophales bacterium]